MIKLETGIYRRTDGRLKVRTTGTCPRTGKMRERSRTLPPDATLLEARAELARLKTVIQTGAAPAPAAPHRPTVADWAEGWMARKRRHLKPTAARDYKQAIENHILPYLGELYADALRRSDLIEWVEWASERRMESGALYASATVQGWWRVLVQFSRDLSAELDTPDPTRRVRSPRLSRDPRRERRTLGAEQLGALLEACARFAPTRYAEVVTLALTGVRAGELYGLEWGDLDEDAECIHVRRSFSDGHLTTPKTSAGHRQVYLHPTVAEALRAHRVRLMRAEHPGLEAGIMFPSDLGTRRHASSLTKTMRLVAEHIGLDVKLSPQVLRRTFNSLLVAGGVDHIVLRSQMGHTREEMTVRYSAIELQAKKRAVLRVLGGGQLGSPLGSGDGEGAESTQVGVEGGGVTR